MAKNFYITTPIYYPSGKPHMGHAYSSIIADIFARFKRLEGFNVLFLTGTDEHGLKIQREAEKNNKDPKIFCDDISKKFKDLTNTLNLSNDDFIRTTETRHYKSVENIWNRLIDSGDIYLDKYKGWYSISDEAYYDNDEIDEINGKKISKISGSAVDWVEEESYFFKLSVWGKKLLDHYKNNKHIIYVWLDALTNYLSALDFHEKDSKKYKNFWPADVHIIGKDILRFHAIYWPAFLLAAKLPLPKRIFGHGWILSDSKKMSKSLGNILDPLEIINTFGIDQLRYYLVKEVSLGNDGSISLENLKNCINNDLANNYGNLCQRVFSFIKKNCSNKIPKLTQLTDTDKSLLNGLKNDLINLKEFMNNQNLNEYLKRIVSYSFDANKYFNDSEPWSIKTTNPKRMNTILFVICEQIKNISILLSPIIPISANKVLKTLNIKDENKSLDQINSLNSFNHDIELKELDILFTKIENDN